MSWHPQHDEQEELHPVAGWGCLFCLILTSVGISLLLRLGCG